MRRVVSGLIGAAAPCCSPAARSARVAEGRGRNAETRRRPEAQIVGDRNERGQIGEFTTAHS